MATNTQYNPNHDLNARLLEAGASKTVYALVTPETERMKNDLLGDVGSAVREAYLDEFRGAWTGKQDHLHNDFFDKWHEWSSPVVDLDYDAYPYRYPTAGASEALRHIIYDHAIKSRMIDETRPSPIHVFFGEYEGYKAYAEAVGIEVIEHDRDDWATIYKEVSVTDLFIVSQPSAIDGNVWPHFNEFVATFGDTWNEEFRPLVIDVTYVGAVPESSIKARFNLNHDAIRCVVFSLSKPFGVYYDRIGGVWCRDEDMGLFGNKWFKNLTSLTIGTSLMHHNSVFDYPEKYGALQKARVAAVGEALGLPAFQPSDVYVLASYKLPDDVTAFLTRGEMASYLTRSGTGGVIRVCLTPGMAKEIGTA